MRKIQNINFKRKNMFEKIIAVGIIIVITIQ